MRILNTKQVRGFEVVTVQLHPGEKLVVIDPNLHYKLGEPMHEDVFAGHILADATATHWCSLEQKWI